MFALQIVILGLLLAIFVQDLKSRSVYWFWFPLLVVALIILGLQHSSFKILFTTSLVNSGFVIFQLALLSLYFSFKERRFVNITESLLGWGDILFLLTICWYFATLNFFLFYIASLVIVILIWSALPLLKNKYRHIPLAGLQSVIFIVCLIADWTSPNIDLTNDFLLLNYLYK